MKKTVPEPEAELLSASEIHDDVFSLQSALEQRKAERQAYNILARPQIREMLSQVIASGICADEEEAILRALKTLVTAVTR